MLEMKFDNDILKDEILDVSGAVAWNYIYYLGSPEIFVYDGYIYCSPNNSIFGTNAHLRNNRKECHIIFGENELIEILNNNIFTVDNLHIFESELTDEIVKCVENILL